MSFNYVNTRLLVGDYKACFQFYNTVMGFEAMRYKPALLFCPTRS